MSSRKRCWCFTINNYTEVDVSRLTLECANAKYLVYGFEVGELNKVPHIQGYVQFENPRTRNGLVKRWLQRAHFDESKECNARRARLYCLKGFQPKAEWERFHETGPTFGIGARTVELGEFSSQGERTDLAALRKHIASGGRMRDLIDNDIDPRLFRHAQNIQEFVAPTKTEAPEVFWVWGPSSAGKTRFCRLVLPDEPDSEFFTVTSLRWWGGYDGQRNVIVDDFRFEPHLYSFQRLLRLIGEDKVTVEAKGRELPFTSKRIFFTAPFPPEVAFEFAGEDLTQFLRRVSHVVEMKPDPNRPTRLPERAVGTQAELLAHFASRRPLAVPAELGADSVQSAQKSGGVIVGPPSSSDTSRLDNVKLCDAEVDEFLADFVG